jgi:hypothetical protein
MLRHFSPRGLLPAGLVVAGLLVLGLPGHGRQRPGGGEPAKKEPTRLYYGVSACAGCHTTRTQVKGDPPVLCRCDEAKRWADNDKHKDAYTALRGKRSKRMAQLLGYRRPAHESPECLSCHALAVADKKLQDDSFKIGDGVSCVACHGPYEEWVSLHGSPLGKQRKEWREKSREEKEAKFGMADLWDPAKRTRLCASCHVGNTAEGKFVTHAMYAAGHPPLPGLEVATFSDEMPRHWQYLREKTPDVQALLKFDREEAQFEKTKLVAVNGLICLRETLNLLTTQADPAGRRTLDFAHFDCYACHHELKSPGWRQQRGSRGAPGRPRMRAWSVTLARVAVRQAGADENEFRARLNDLDRAFDSRPFGDPEAVAKAAAALIERLDGAAKKLADTKYTRARARELVAELCRLPENDVPDYDSARQRAWAFRIVYGELEPKPSAEVTALFADLEQQLKLKLPSTRDVQILDQLPTALERISAYDPRKFTETFSKLARHVPDK